MNDKILQSILDIPIFWRALVVFFILWILYLIFSRVIFKLVSLVISLLNKIWVFPYLLFNNMMHILHKIAGKALIGVDQAITNFFGNVYNFIYKIKLTIEGFCVKKIPVYDIYGKQVFDQNGIPQYNNISQRPFVGYALIFSLLLVLWISLPSWLHIEDKNTVFNVAYTTFTGMEKEMLEMIFYNK